MRIDSQNIEEVFFDFHEGNLADAEKAALMDFLHKHPEYEREFVLWAKTYHVDKQLLDYGQTDRFVKKPMKAPLRWASAAVGTGLAVLAAWYWWPTPVGLKHEDPLEAKKESVPVLEQKQVTELEEKSRQRETVLQPKRPAPDVEEPSQEVIDPSSGPQVLAQDTMSKQDEQHPSVLVDSATVPVERPQVAEPPVEKKVAPSPSKAKRRRKLDLTPSDEIVPMNPDL